MKNETKTAEYLSKRIMEYCMNDGEREYVEFHSIRFSIIIKQLLSIININDYVAGIGISILDPYINNILLDMGAKYSILIPNEKYARKFDRVPYDLINREVIDLTKPSDNLISKFDVLVFYETLEHMFAPDETIISNLYSLLKPGGILLGSVPNAVWMGARINVLIGRNIFWNKTNIVNGVFGGFGHIREYTFKEVKELLCNYFARVRLQGFSPYKTHGLLFLSLFPKAWNQVIFFKAEK